MATKLKVFTWSDGFHAFTVAASSRPKALAAWGVDQDLFKTGLAHEAEEGPDREAALAAPGAVILRALVLDIGKPRIGKSRSSPERRTAKVLTRIAALEADIKALDADHAVRMEPLDRRQAALDDDRAQLDADHAKARERLMAKIRTARTAL